MEVGIAVGVEHRGRNIGARAHVLRLCRRLRVVAAAHRVSVRRGELAIFERELLVVPVGVDAAAAELRAKSTGKANCVHVYSTRNGQCVYRR